MSKQTIIAAYETQQQEYETLFQAESRKHFRLGMLRLLVSIGALACFYAYYVQQEILCLIVGVLATITFFLLMKMQEKVQQQKLLAQAMAEINKEEAAYLREGHLPFASGVEYKNPEHAYADDLDLFGNRSLYQHLNRTATQMGRAQLATSLQQLLPASQIAKTQEAVAELAGKQKERQHLYAMGRLAGDSKESYAKLISWSQQTEQPLNKALIVVAYILPVIVFTSLLLYGITKTETWWTIFTRTVPVNLLLFSFMIGRIRKAIGGAGRIQDTLKAYSGLLEQIEKMAFQSTHLQALQQQLKFCETTASVQFRQLAKIYSGMENVNNPFAAIGMNGLYLYHIHTLNKLVQWKQKSAVFMAQWLDVIGQIEMLNSLANLKNNNPDFCFPALNEQQIISFEALGHPLIPATKRVCNDIQFDQHRFVILTGSNMSGKSTFLRTLGINMVLAGMGSVLCAAQANIQPMPVFVSMRQSDSLADSESYFFAEVKRLKFIIDQLNDQVSFVLLDEILRGTNSDDKRSGTIGVIEKIIRTKAIGAIATHDLEVCLTTNEHPEMLINKCFEVAITNNELEFDYKLRNGICQNKSATFLMKKMEII